MRSSKHRHDIQALRGIAVLLVLVFHAKIGGLAAGYLGVDIFYVISGFLITGLVARQVDAGDFSFVRFYLNRARRLLPAAYIVYLATACAAFFLLTDLEYERFQDTLVGAITFTANIELWQGTNYFSSAAKLNPLTHTWSLSIEEQYYLLLPLTLFLIPRQFWVVGTVFVLATSLALCLYLSVVSPVASFYLLPTRAWELAIGSLIALTGLRIARTGVIHAPVVYLAIAVMLLVPAFAPGEALGSLHPGMDAILVCVATGYLLVARSSMLETGATARLLAKIGDMSYSLYLVHWPLFAFAYNAHLGETPSLELRIFLLVVSFVTAYGVYRLVETPTRRITIARPQRALATAIIASLAVVMVSQGLQAARTSNKDYAQFRDWNAGFDQRCATERGSYKPIAACRNRARPKILIWGDSFAMHLVHGMAATTNAGIEQATRPSCGPLLGIAHSVRDSGCLNSGPGTAWNSTGP